METQNSFDSQLLDALEHRRAWLESGRIPQLKQEFHLFHSSFRALLQVLEKKGLVQPDPYKAEERISEVKAPSDDPFLESERDAQMSIRLSQFDNQLDFVTSYFQFDLEFMTLPRMKNLVALVKFVQWHQLSEGSQHLITRTFAQYANRVIGEHDQFSGSIIKDSQEQLRKRTRAILTFLKEIADYQRERLKLDLRISVLPKCGFDPARVLADTEAALRQIRKQASLAQPPVPFFADLAQEIIAETFSPDAPTLQKELLGRISPDEKKPKTQAPTDEFRLMLQEAVRSLVTAGGTLSGLLEKTSANAELLRARKLSISELLKRWVDRMTNRTTDQLVFPVESLDENTATRRTEQIEFEQFAASVEKRVRLYAAVLNRVSAPARRIQEAGEDQLFSFLQKEVEELYTLQRQFGSIDTYNRSEVTREQRAQLRPVNVDLSALKEHLLRINKKRHSYVARKEEQEQLRKLGITTEDT